MGAEDETASGRVKVIEGRFARTRKQVYKRDRPRPAGSESEESHVKYYEDLNEAEKQSTTPAMSSSLECLSMCFEVLTSRRKCWNEHHYDRPCSAQAFRFDQLVIIHVHRRLLKTHDRISNDPPYS